MNSHNNAHRKQKSRPRNAVAKIVRTLAEEIDVVLTEGLESERLHAPLGEDDCQAASMMLRLRKAGTISIHINQRQLAEKSGYSKDSIFPVLKLLLQLRVVSHIDSKVYVVGYRDHESKESFIPIHIVKNALMNIRSVDKKNRHQRLYQELLRLSIDVQLLKAAVEKQRFFQFQDLVEDRKRKVVRQIESLEGLMKYYPSLPSSKLQSRRKIIVLSERIKKSLLELIDNKEDQYCFSDDDPSIRIILFSYYSLKKKLINKDNSYRRTGIEETVLKPRVLNRLQRDKKRHEAQELAKTTSYEQKLLNLIADTRARVFNREPLDYVDIQQASPNLKRAVKLVAEYSRSPKISAPVLLQNTFALYRLKRHENGPPLKWIGGEEFQDYLSQAATAIREIEKSRRKRGKKGDEYFEWWIDKCQESFQRILGITDILAVGSEYLREYNEWCLLRACVSRQKIRNEFEFTTGLQMFADDYIVAQVLYFKNFVKVELTGRVFLDHMSGERAENRAKTWIVKNESFHTIPPERKRELEKWWESQTQTAPTRLNTSS